MLVLLAECSFNLVDHGRTAFELLASLVRSCECFELVMGDLDEAVGLVLDAADRSSLVGVASP